MSGQAVRIDPVLQPRWHGDVLRALNVHFDNNSDFKTVLDTFIPTSFPPGSRPKDFPINAYGSDRIPGWKAKLADLDAGVLVPGFPPETKPWLALLCDAMSPEGWTAHNLKEWKIDVGPVEPQVAAAPRAMKVKDLPDALKPAALTCLGYSPTHPVTDDMVLDAATLSNPNNRQNPNLAALWGQLEIHSPSPSPGLPTEYVPPYEGFAGWSHNFSRLNLPNATDKAWVVMAPMLQTQMSRIWFDTWSYCGIPDMKLWFFEKVDAIFSEAQHRLEVSLTPPRRPRVQWIDRTRVVMYGQQNYLSGPISEHLSAPMGSRSLGQDDRVSLPVIVIDRDEGGTPKVSHKIIIRL